MFSFFSFQVKANFTAVYHNFTSLHNLNVCIDYSVIAFHTRQYDKSMFEGITCGNLNTSKYRISENLHVLEKHYICPHDTELYNLTTSDKNNYTQYCGNFVFFVTFSYILYSVLDDVFC